MFSEVTILNPQISKNAHTCFYKNNVLQYFATDPPLLEEYFQSTELCA